jgi:pyruvate ferredoxin oxidoreductase alpha subunit
MSQRCNNNGRGITMKRIGIEASHAVAEAIKLANVDVVAAYPITPQTHIVERLAEMIANGDINGQYIPVESEHSAMSACMGSVAVGARTFTSTASQGLELMHEVLFVTSAMRLPVIMLVANRALSGPLNIWGDHSDIMAARDCGWIQLFAANAQEAFDLTLCAFKIGEDKRVLLPVMVNIDGFHVSHVIESLEVIEQPEADKFLPKFIYPDPLDPARPVTMGAYALPNTYTEVKRSQLEAINNSKSIILQVLDEYGKLTGKKHLPVEKYNADNTETLFICIGSFAETVSSAIDNLKEEGIEVGLIRILLWRPFPFDEFKKAVSKAKTLIILDRSVIPGGPNGPLCSEIKTALYGEKNAPNIVSFVGGLGGRDISAKTFENIIKQGIKMAGKAAASELNMIEVRE